MKNYILLGIGIGMIISGTIFNYFENKDYRDLEVIIRREIEEEMRREEAFQSIERELESLFLEAPISDIVEDKENKNENLVLEDKSFEVEEQNMEFLKNEKLEEKESLLIHEESTELIEEEVFSNQTGHRLALEKFLPLKDAENIYNIQFRSSQSLDEVLRVQNLLENIIDTKVEFVQGYYRLFAEELYSKEYSEIIAHEIRNEFNLNPVIRTPRQLDYLKLGPRRYNEKYYGQDKKEVAEEVLNDIKIEKTKEVSEEKKIDIVEDEQLLEEDILEVKEELATDLEEGYKLLFMAKGDSSDMEDIKGNIENLIELIIKNEDGYYRVESKERFSDFVAEDIISKLRLLFGMEVVKIK